MRLLFIFIFAFSLAATTVAAQQPTSRPLVPAAQASVWEQVLRDADLDFARQTAARRLEGWMDFFADDASIIHDGQTVTGKDALRTFYQPVFANKDFNLTWLPKHAEASRMAPWAIPMASMKPEMAQQSRAECTPPSGER